MTHSVLQVHPDDDMLVALADLPAGTRVQCNGYALVVPGHVPSKHKLTVRAFAQGERLKMYGITVAVATRPIAAGEWLTPQNIAHVTDPPTTGQRQPRRG